jgi:hypothetical protein
MYFNILIIFSGELYVHKRSKTIAIGNHKKIKKKMHKVVILIKKHLTSAKNF